MKNKKTIIAITDSISSAEKSLKIAKKLLKDLISDNGIELETNITYDTNGLNCYSDDNGKIVEGVFTGIDMLDCENNRYPVPVNYASKSKLVQGDKLKLIISLNGQMTYKQISPIERETQVGLLTKEQGKYQVISNGEAYDVLTAAVTHFKGEIGDKVLIILPTGKNASFAAIDNILPREE